MRQFFAVLVLAALYGCATKPRVTDVSGDQTVIDGIPFRVSADHLVRIYRWSEETDKYELVSQTNQRLADQRRLYALSFTGDTFATRSLHVVENADNTLSKMGLAAQDSTPAALDAVSAAVTNRRTAESAKQAAIVSHAGAVLSADKAVRDAQQDLDELPSTTSAATRALHEQILVSAVQAAAAVRAAGGK